MFFEQDKLEDNSKFWRLIRLQVTPEKVEGREIPPERSNRRRQTAQFPPISGLRDGGGDDRLVRFGRRSISLGKGGVEERGRERESYLPSKYPSFLRWKRKGEGTEHRAFHVQRHSSLLWVGGWFDPESSLWKGGGS